MATRTVIRRDPRRHTGPNMIRSQMRDIPRKLNTNMHGNRTAKVVECGPVLGRELEQLHSSPARSPQPSARSP